MACPPCDEKKKSYWYANCSGQHRRCIQCGQSVCYYHGAANNGGIQGGHGGCTIECETTYKHMCAGHMTKCEHCDYSFCGYHSEPVSHGAVPTGGHVCRVTAGVGEAAAAVAAEIAKAGSLALMGGAGIALRTQFKLAQEAVASLGIVPQKTAECSLLELARMSDAVYALHEKPNMKGNSHYEELKGMEWSVAEQHQQAHFGTDYPCVAFAVFVKLGLAVLALKGTDPGSGTDVEMDLSSIIAGIPPSGPLQTLAEVVQKYQAKRMEVMVTGHSLGGYMAEVLATNLGLAGVGFCAPGSGWHAGRHGGEGQGFQNVNFEHDRAGNAMPGVFTHPQWSVYVVKFDDYMHDMDEMVECMKEISDWTNQDVVSRSKGYKTGYYIRM